MVSEQRFPDFSFLFKDLKDVNKKIDMCLIGHFHLDHCGALPYFTEMVGFDGPVIMTHPTKAIIPLMLQDYMKVWH